MIALEYIQGADLPDDALELLDSRNQVINLTGHTFALKLQRGIQALTGADLTLNKTTGFTGASTSPNLTIAWATSGDLNSMDPGRHTGHLIATRTADSKQRVFPVALNLLPAA